MWIFKLLFFLPFTGIHGLKDPNFLEDYYEEYVEEPALNTTSYKLVVPERFTSYLEHLLANESSATLDGGGTKVNKSTEFSGTKDENRVRSNQQYSKHKPNLNNSNRIDLHQTLESLATSFANSTNSFKSSRPTIFHPYGTQNTSQLLSSLATDQHHSSPTNQKQEQINSPRNKHMAFQTNKALFQNRKRKIHGHRVVNHTKYNPTSKIIQKFISKSRSGKKETQNMTKSFSRDDRYITSHNHSQNNSDLMITEASSPIIVNNRSYLPTYLNKTINNRTSLNNALLGKNTSDGKPATIAPTTNNGSILQSSTKEKTNSGNLYISKGHLNISHSLSGVNDDEMQVGRRYDPLKVLVNESVVSGKDKTSNTQQNLRNISAAIFPTKSHSNANRENNIKLTNATLKNNPTNSTISQGLKLSNSYDVLEISNSSTSKPRTYHVSNKNDSNVTDKIEEGKDNEEWFTEDGSVETTSLENDQTTRNETEKHPIEELLDSLVKITSSKKSLKRRKKKKIRNKSTNEQLHTNIQPKVDTVKLNDNVISHMNVQTVQNKTQMSKNQSKQADLIMGMGKEALPSNISKTHLQKSKQKLESSKSVDLFNIMDDHQPVTTRLPVKNSESVSKGNHVGLPNSKVKFSSRGEVKNIQSLMSQYESILNKLINKNHHFNHSIITDINKDKNNSPHKINTQSGKLDSPSPTEHVISKEGSEKSFKKRLNSTEENDRTYSFTKVAKPYFIHENSNEKERTTPVLSETRHDKIIQVNHNVTLTKNKSNVLSTWPNKTTTSGNIQNTVNNLIKPEDSIKIESTLDNLPHAETKDTHIPTQTYKVVSPGIEKEEHLLPTKNITKTMENSYGVLPFVEKRTTVVPEKLEMLPVKTNNTSQVEVESENFQKLLTNNKAVENIDRKNAYVPHGAGLYIQQHDVHTLVKSYLGKKNKTKDFGGYTSRPHGSKSYAAVKEVKYGDLAKANKFVNRSLSQPEKNLEKPLFKTTDDELAGGESVKLLSSKGNPNQELIETSNSRTNNPNENSSFIYKGEDPKNLENPVTDKISHPNVKQTNKSEKPDIFSSDKLKLILNQTGNLKINDSALIKLKKIKDNKIETDDESADVQARPNFDKSSFNLSNNEQSASKKYYSTAHAYENEDKPKQRKQVIKLKHDQEVEEKELNQIMANLNNVIIDSDLAHSNTNEANSSRQSGEQLDDNIPTDISKNVHFNVTSQLVPDHNENFKRYSQKDKAGSNTNRSELLNLAKEKHMLSKNINGVRDSSVLNNSLSLNGDSLESSLSNIQQYHQLNFQYKSFNRTIGEKNKNETQQHDRENSYPNDPAITKQKINRQKERFIDKIDRRNVSLKSEDGANPFVSKNTTEPLITSDERSNNKPSIAFIKNTLTSLHNQELINAPHVKQNTYMFNPLSVMESNDDAETETLVQGRRDEYTSIMNKTIAQKLDPNSRLHIIIAPLEHNISVKIKIENKNSSAKGNALQQQMKTSVNSEDPALVSMNINSHFQINPSKLKILKTNSSGKPLIVGETQNLYSKKYNLPLKTKESNNLGKSVFDDQNQNNSSQENPSQIQDNESSNSGIPVIVDQSTTNSSKGDISQLQDNEYNKSLNPVFAVQNKTSSSQINTSQLQNKEYNSLGNPVSVLQNNTSSSKTNKSQLQDKESNKSGNPVFVVKNNTSSSKTNKSQKQDKESNNLGNTVFLSTNKKISSKTNASQSQDKESYNLGDPVFDDKNKNSSSKSFPSQSQLKESDNLGNHVFVDEYGNNSSKTNQSKLFQTNESNNSGSPVFVDKNKTQFKNSSVDVMGSSINIKQRSMADQLNLNKQIDKSIPSNNTHLPTVSQAVESKNLRDENVNSTTTEKLLTSKDNTLKLKSKCDDLLSKDLSLDVKRANKVTNRKRITKKEEVVEENEKIKENQILGKSKTIQTIKTEINSVDYV